MLNVMSYFEEAMGLKTTAYTLEQKNEIEDICLIEDADILEDDYIEDYDRLCKVDIEEDDTESLLLQERLIKHWLSITRKDYRKEQIVDDFIDTSMSLGHINYEAEHMRFFPEKYNRDVGKSGAWIMVIDEPAIKPAPIKYSVYYALPANISQRITGYGYKTVVFPYHKVKIMLEGAEIHLWPHEYMKVPLEAILEEVGNSFDRIELGGNPSYDQSKLHFLKLRGLSQVDIYKILLKSVNSLNHVYFKIRPEAVEFWDFYVSALQKGIRPEMALHIWDCRINNKPLFNIQVKE